MGLDNSHTGWSLDVIWSTRNRNIDLIMSRVLGICQHSCAGKGTVHTRTGHEGPDGQERYSCTVSLTSALEGGGGQRHAPAALRPGKTVYILYRGLRGPQGRSGEENIAPHRDSIPAPSSP